MRLVFLTTSYPLAPGSVAGIFVARMVQRLPPQISTTVLTPALSRPYTPQPTSPINIHAFRYAPYRLQILAQGPGGIPATLRTRKWTYLLLPGFLLSMFLSCLRHGQSADLLHANWAICGCIGGMVGKLLRVPVVTTLRGSDIARAQQSMIDKAILSLCMRWSDSVITVSHAIANWIREQYPAYSEKIQTIENGVEDALLKMPAKREFSTATPLRLITIASLIPGKGIDQIIRALHKLPRAERLLLTVVGEGPERARLTQLAITLGLQNSVEFIGTIPPPAVAGELAKAHLFVLASISEGRPNVILEAMATALPVIASDIPGVDELVSHGQTGFLFQPGVIDQLAEYIQTLLDNATLREQLGRTGRDFILRRQLHWGATAERYFQLYRKISRTKHPCAE